jgi:aspartate kinase
MLCVVDAHDEKVEGLALQAAALFDVNVTRGLTLLTVRHYQEPLLSTLIGINQVVLKQQTPETVQVLIRERAD